MAAIGLNVPRDGSAPADLIRSLGASWARLVAVPDVDLSEAMRDYHAAGVRVLLVLARESGGNYAAYRDRYAELVDAIEVGNEPDLDSPSSWTLTQGELAALGRTVRALFPSARLVLGGLASGQPSWLNGMDLDWADAIGVHPYGKAPYGNWPAPGWGTGVLGDLLDGYASFGKPLWVTEIGLDTNEVSEEMQAGYVTRCLDVLGHRADVEATIWFCLSDAMVPNFGLLRTDGSEKPAATAFRLAAATAPAPLPIPVEVPTVPEETPPSLPAIVTLDDVRRLRWQAVTPRAAYNPALGFEQYWQEHPEIGSPLTESELTLDTGEQCRPFVNAILVWKGDHVEAVA